MSPIFSRLSAIFQDAPPEFAFEIGLQSIAMARAVGGAQPVVEELEPTVLSPSPIRDNVLDADAFARAFFQSAARFVQAKRTGLWG